jgi:membrane-associated phospholipid phosphatase
VTAWLYLGTALLLGTACVVAQGPLPGDVAVARALQALLGADAAWAKLLTDTAKPPLVWATAAVAALLAFARGGWRSAVVPPLGLVVAYGLDVLLRAAVFAPRPSPGLVTVLSAGSGSGLPSTFGLAYGALFGAVLLARRPRRARAARAAGAVAALLLVAGACARVVLAGHWPSQLLASVLLAVGVAAALQRGVRAA